MIPRVVDQVEQRDWRKSPDDPPSLLRLHLTVVLPLHRVRGKAATSVRDRHRLQAFPIAPGDTKRRAHAGTTVRRPQHRHPGRSGPHVAIDERGGLPGVKARHVLEDRQFRAAVDADWQRSRALGISVRSMPPERQRKNLSSGSHRRVPGFKLRTRSYARKRF